MLFRKWHLTSLSKKWLLALGGICLCFIAYDLIALPAAKSPDPLIEVLSPEDAEQAAVSATDFTVDAAGVEEKGGDFYAAYRMEREQVRAKEQQMLDNIVGNALVSVDAKEAANSRKLSIAKAMDQEMQLESLIKAKDFSDAAVFIQDGSATVVVSGKLDDKGAIVIADLVQGVTGIAMEKLVIIEKS